MGLIWVRGPIEQLVFSEQLEFVDPDWIYGSTLDLEYQRRRTYDLKPSETKGGCYEWKEALFIIDKNHFKRRGGKACLSEARVKSRGAGPTESSVLRSVFARSLHSLQLFCFMCTHRPPGVPRILRHSGHTLLIFLCSQMLPPALALHVAHQRCL